MWKKSCVGREILFGWFAKDFFLSHKLAIGKSVMICTLTSSLMLTFWAAEVKDVLRVIISPERCTCCWLFLHMKFRT